MPSNGVVLIGGGGHANNMQSQVVPAYMPQLEKQAWYHGKITRKQAETMLNNKPIGSFLVRQSESGNLNDFSLSLVYVFPILKIKTKIIISLIFSW